MSELRNRFHCACRSRHVSPRTERSYRAWVRRYLIYHGNQNPADLEAEHATAFLNHLAVDRDVAASTQNQALCAILFLYRRVLGKELPWLDDLVRARRSRHLPVVLTREEVRAVLDAMDGTPAIMARILYGAGLRLLECACLRVKDVDLRASVLTIRAPKSRRDRPAVLPESLESRIGLQVQRVSEQHTRDLSAGAGWVELPHAFARKSPGAARSLEWQWLFPATRTYRHRDTGQCRRHHLHETVVQRAVRSAASRAGMTKRVTCHTFRHSFATHLLEDGHDIRTVQELLGHRSVKTTMIYTHVLNRGPSGIRSPLDRL